MKGSGRYLAFRPAAGGHTYLRQIGRPDVFDVAGARVSW